MKKKRITKQILVIVLTLVTMFASIPINAFAETNDISSIETEVSLNNANDANNDSFELEPDEILEPFPELPPEVEEIPEVTPEVEEVPEATPEIEEENELEYTVKFFANNDTNDYFEIKVYEGSELKMPENRFSYANHELIYWENKKTHNCNSIGSFIDVYEDMEFQAVWLNLCNINIVQNINVTDDIYIAKYNRYAPDLGLDTPISKIYEGCEIALVIKKGDFEIDNIILNNNGYTEFNTLDNGIKTTDNYYYLDFISYDNYNIKINYKTCNISFDANGGNGNMNDNTIVCSSSYTLPKCEFARKDYIFDGWLDSSTNTIYKPGSLVTLSSDTTFYAHWKYKNINVTFDPNGGIGTYVDDNTYEKGESYTLPDNPYTYDEYYFVGWDINGKIYKPGESYVVTDDITLKASWKPNSHKVTYIYGDNDLDTYIDDVLYDETYIVKTLEDLDVTKEGYTFLGWYNGDSKVEDSLKIKGDVILSAKWSINSYKLTFESNYNEANLKPIVTLTDDSLFNGIVEYNKEIKFNLLDYDKENYVFDKSTFDDTEFDLYDLDKTFIMPSHDVKVIVNFIKKVEITYDSNSGTGTMDKAKVVPGSDFEIPKCTFKRSGYTFKCWEYNGLTYKPGQVITPKEDVVLKALWTKNPDPAPTNNNDSSNSDDDSNANSNTNTNSNSAQTVINNNVIQAPPVVIISPSNNTRNNTKDNVSITNDDEIKDDDSLVRDTKDDESISDDDASEEIMEVEEEIPKEPVDLKEDNNEKVNKNSKLPLAIGVSVVAVISISLIAIFIKKFLEEKLK